MLAQNQRLSICNLVSFALQTYHDNISIENCLFENDIYTININRYISINHLKKLNKYFDITLKDKNIKYTLIVTKECVTLHLTNFENFNEYYANNDNFFNKITLYNNNVSKYINNYFYLLKEVLWPTDSYMSNWTFYYKSIKNNHLGFADRILEKDNCIKIFTNAINTINIDELYNRTFNIFGTENDAKIIKIRRNKNSRFYKNWSYCEVGTPLVDLL